MCRYDLLAGYNEMESYYLIREEENLRLGMVKSEGQNYLETYLKAIFEVSAKKYYHREVTCAHSV